MDFSTLTDEEFLQALDRSDPLQARMEQILLSSPTQDDLSEDWLSPDKVVATADALVALVDAAEALDVKLRERGKPIPDIIQNVINEAAKVNQVFNSK